MNKFLHELYLKPDSSTYLAGINALYREAKKHFPRINKNDINKFLSKQDVYTLHKPNIKYKPSNIISAGLDCDWQIDLADMQKLKKYNQGYGYIFTCIDVLSKFGWAIPIKVKESKEIIRAFKEILKSGRKPWRLFSDKGREFTNAPFQKFLHENDIKFIAMENPITKAANVERYNRTLKTRIYKYFTLNNTKTWTRILPKIVKAINHSVNRMHGMRPADINHKNDQTVYQKLYKKSSIKVNKQKFNIGDLVRITKEGVFEKGYKPTRTHEIFVVSEVINRKPYIYKLKDLKNEDLTSIFYTEELVRVNDESE